MPVSTIREFVIDKDEASQRLDRWLADQLEHSRTRIQDWIKESRVRVNGAPARASYALGPGDRLTIEIPDPASETVAAELIPLPILFEDSSIIAINKPSGMVVYPAAGHPNGTLVNGLLAHCSLASIGAPRRPGIVHRLDAGTSGVIVVAKTDSAYHHLVNQFKTGGVSKKYLVLVQGRIKEDEGLIDAPLGRDPHNYQRMKVTSKLGKPAVTEFSVIKRFQHQTLVEAYPKTGRTHQIRVHFSAIGYPLVGDDKYGRESVPLVRLYLHAWELQLWHPTIEERITFTAPLPPEFAALFAREPTEGHFASSPPPPNKRERSRHK